MVPLEIQNEIIDCLRKYQLPVDLDIHIINKTGLPVHIAEDPLFSVVKGTGMVLEDINKYKEVLIAP